MGSGHTNRRRRSGGGPARARHGPQRQQNPEVRNEQVHPEEPTQTMKTAATPVQPAPRQAPREQAQGSGPRPEHEPRRHPYPAQPPRGENTTRPRQEWLPPSRIEAPRPYRPAFAVTPSSNGNGNGNGNGQMARPPVAQNNGAHNGFKHVQPEQPPARVEEDDWDESEAEPVTGANPLVRPSSYNASEPRDREVRPEVRGEFAPLIDALRDLFQHDRAVASQGNSTRCGICYLHFTVVELEYRESEGFYICPDCKQSLSRSSLPMIRRQQR